MFNIDDELTSVVIFPDLFIHFSCMTPPLGGGQSNYDHGSKLFDQI